MNNYERFLAERAETERWLKSNDLIGITEAELIARAKTAGIAVRIDMRDGRDRPMAAYASGTEVTAHLEHGRVVAVRGSY